MEKEEWRVVERFPNYEVSNLGQIKVKNGRYSGKIRKAFLVSGRPAMGFWDIRHPKYAQRLKWQYIHILVCEAFHGPKPTVDHQVAHYDGDRYNNRADNLRWATRAENNADSVRHRLERRANGQEVAYAKLTTTDVLSIDRLLQKGYSQADIARKYSVKHSTISDIARRRSWGWLLASTMTSATPDWPVISSRRRR